MLYVAYIVMIGGDHMSGRLLVAPFVVAVAIIARHAMAPPAGAVQAACLLLLGACNLGNTLLAPTELPPSAVRLTGIANERAYLFSVYGLTRIVRQRLATPPWPKHLRRPARVVILTCGGLGTQGMLDGPATHVADRCGLADPLMARLPAQPDPDWRIGHIIRAVPDGYPESLVADGDLVKDRQVAALYQRS